MISVCSLNGPAFTRGGTYNIYQPCFMKCVYLGIHYVDTHVPILEHALAPGGDCSDFTVNNKKSDKQSIPSPRLYAHEY